MHCPRVVAIVKFIARKVRKLSRTAPHIFLIATTSLTIHANASADSLDGVCFPAFRENQALPAHQDCAVRAADDSCTEEELKFCMTDPARIKRYCDDKSKTDNSCERMVGNPIDSGTGNKHLVEVDYTNHANPLLSFKRYYNSSSKLVQKGILGKLWRTDFDRRIIYGRFSGPSDYPQYFMTSLWTDVALYRPDGSIINFKLRNGQAVSDPHTGDRLTPIFATRLGKEHVGGWEFRSAQDELVETYDEYGFLVNVANKSGQSISLEWNGAYSQKDYYGNVALVQITDQAGRTLKFSSNYPATHATTMTDPEGNVYTYDYDDGRRLTSVKFPDSSSSVRTYLYNEPEFTSGTDLFNALTGIIDESGTRFAIYRYDNSGRAISTAHAGGANSFRLAFEKGQTTVTDPLGTSRKYRFASVKGSLKIAGIDQPGGAGCAAATSGATYDAAGNIATSQDFNGNKVTYSYDLARNLETSRQEAAGTKLTRRTSTQWHGQFRLPVKIAEPKLLTTFEYDAKSRLLTKSEQATNDVNGSQAFAASIVGAARIWRFSYDNSGRLLSAIGPRHDIAEKILYAYDSLGNLATITNALGHVTSFSDYDAHGNAGRIRYANGQSTEIRYDVRNRIQSATTTGLGTTSYQYGATGQLILTTLPDGATIANGYDAAHRLTTIQDGLGNSVRYTLDAMGNRTGETVNDPSGAVVRRVVRAYDPLNRLLQITGADK